MRACVRANALHLLALSRQQPADPLSIPNPNPAPSLAGAQISERGVSHPLRAEGEEAVGRPSLVVAQQPHRHSVAVLYVLVR